MRKLLGVSLLVLLLSGSTIAGVIPNDTPAPPPPPQTGATPEPTGGEMPNDAPESLTQTVLDLLALLPSLL